MERLSRADLINYLTLAATDIREREYEIERIHGEAGNRKDISAAEIRSLAAQVFHGNRHLSNLFVMLAKRLEDEEAIAAARRVNQAPVRRRLYKRLQKSIAALLKA